MFTLTLHDRKGAELNEGDIVKISDGKHFGFYAKVSYSEKDQCIRPFHTFSYHSFEKVDKVPANAVKSTGDENYWYVPDPKEEDKSAEEFEGYLTSWCDCENMLENDCYRIKRS